MDQGVIFYTFGLVFPRTLFHSFFDKASSVLEHTSIQPDNRNIICYLSSIISTTEEINLWDAPKWRITVSDVCCVIVWVDNASAADIRSDREEKQNKNNMGKTILKRRHRKHIMYSSTRAHSHSVWSAKVEFIQVHLWPICTQSKRYEKIRRKQQKLLESHSVYAVAAADAVHKTQWCSSYVTSYV